MKHSEPLIMDAMIKLTEQVDVLQCRVTTCEQMQQRLQQQVDAAKELLDGLVEEDLNSSTGIPLNRCRELLEVIFDA
jgi:hypothetical protein